MSHVSKTSRYALLTADEIEVRNLQFWVVTGGHITDIIIFRWERNKTSIPRNEDLIEKDWPPSTDYEQTLPKLICQTLPGLCH